LLLHRLRALGVGALAALASAFLLPAASAQAATPPSGMFGLGDWAWPSAATLDRQSAHGLKTWRVPLSYTSVGGVQGSLNFSGYDTLIANAAKDGVAPLFVLTGCPAWACPTGGPANSATALPGWKAFVTAAVQRYGSNGSFWATHPIVPKVPVTSWQVLNEVNGSDQWPSPDPAAYAAMLIATSASIRAADPAAKVVLSGLPQKMTIWMKDYLPALYAVPGFKAAVDVIAIHGYAVLPTDVPAILDTAKRIMIANGDAAKPLWITEMSWATAGPAHPFVTTEANQAAYLQTSWDTLLGCRARWNLDRVYWYGYSDHAGTPDYWGYHNGLLRLDGTAKPALSAFEQFTAAAPLPGTRGDTCGLPGDTVIDTTVPDTSITAGPPARTNVAQPVFRFASTEAGVHYSCRLDGSAWTACPPAADGTWRPATALAGGTHTLIVAATDAQANTDATPATRTWVRDTTPPDTYVAGTWGNVAVGPVSLTLTASEPVVRYECEVDAGPWATCTSAFSTSLALGHHTISVRSVDVAGNVDPNPAVPWYQVR
jgi:hypothetical protein